VITSMSPSTRYPSIVPVKIVRNSLYGVPPPPPDPRPPAPPHWSVAVAVLSTIRVNGRGKEMPHPRPRAALAETRDENTACMRERIVVRAFSAGDSSRSAFASAFEFRRRERV